MKLAKEILNQLTTLTPKPVIWSWGARSWQAISRDYIKGVGENYEGGLKFNVSGAKFKGHVLITLAYDDTYTITLGHVRKGIIKPKVQLKNVYFEDLGKLIDDELETIKWGVKNEC